MPLHSQHKVIGGGSFKAFDDAVVGAAGYDPQTIANGIGGLVVGGIYREERTSDLRPRTSALRAARDRADDCRQPGIGFDLYDVGHRYVSSGLVVDLCARLFC